MIGFAAEKLMALEVGTKTGAGYGEKNGLPGLPQRNGLSRPATVENTGRAPSSCAFRSFAQAAISRASLEPAPHGGEGPDGR